MVEPFVIAVPDAALDDLDRRLNQTRWPDPEPVDDWSQGAPLSYVQEVCRYWADGYDWRARETALNRFDQFTTTVDGLDIHYVHVRSPEPDALPLLITHGWPGSIVEFHKVIEPLADPRSHGADPADAFIFPVRDLDRCHRSRRVDGDFSDALVRGNESEVVDKGIGKFNGEIARFG